MNERNYIKKDILIAMLHYKRDDSEHHVPSCNTSMQNRMTNRVFFFLSHVFFMYIYACL